MILEGYSVHKKCKCIGCVLVSGEPVQHVHWAQFWMCQSSLQGMRVSDIWLWDCYLTDISRTWCWKEPWKSQAFTSGVQPSCQSSVLKQNQTYFQKIEWQLQRHTLTEVFFVSVSHCWFCHVYPLTNNSLP